MPHSFTVSLRHGIWIGQFRAVRETDIHEILEGVDVTEGRIGYARDGTTVANRLSDIITALPHPQKRVPRDRPQLERFIGQPEIE